MRLAIQREPGNQDYRFRYGMLLVDSKAPAAAVMRLQEAVQEFPDSAQLWFALGFAQFTDNKNDAAAATFEKSLALQKDYVPSLAYLALCRVEKGQYDEAIGLYKRALALRSDLPVLPYLLGEALIKQHPESAEAEPYYRRALELDANFTRARLALGKLLARDGRLEPAQAELQRVVKEDPNSAEAQYQLGRVYTRLKRTELAKATFDRYKILSAQEKQQNVQERRELLSRLADTRF
jgi:tetratricopeptide (TPR) repeat protein